ncbi:hypothetical protein WA158_001243 [Blastocystis sp. Blastoise]
MNYSEKNYENNNPFLPDIEVYESDANINFVTSTFRTATHPKVCLFHVLFKGLSLFYYLFCTFFCNNFIINFVVLILLFAADFWVVKNISGRLLVGLRWWSLSNSDGVSEWQFEAIDDPNLIGPSDYRIFWFTTIGFPIIWILFTLLNVLKFKFDWLIVDCIALILSGTNCYLYYQASKASKTKVTPVNFLPAAFTETAIKRIGQIALQAANIGQTN